MTEYDTQLAAAIARVRRIRNSTIHMPRTPEGMQTLVNDYALIANAYIDAIEPQLLAEQAARAYPRQSSNTGQFGMHTSASPSYGEAVPVNTGTPFVLVVAEPGRPQVTYTSRGSIRVEISEHDGVAPIFRGRRAVIRTRPATTDTKILIHCSPAPITLQHAPPDQLPSPPNEIRPASRRIVAIAE
jgi:hypothetical protein